MKYSVAQQSNQGGRDYNEDSTAVYERDGCILLIVADGLGGHAGGDLASQTFVDALGDTFKRATNEQLENAGQFLTLSINYAHHMIHRRAVSQGFNVDSPKTTCVTCLIKEGVAHWAHSGDSRLYLIRKRHIIEQTVDHVARKHGKESNSPINRCVGGLESPRPDVSAPHKMEDGDCFVLATDGAWASFGADDLRDYIDPQHPSLGLENLLQTLENRNKAPSDNLSMVVFFWGVEQQETPEFNDFREEDTIQLLSTHPYRDEEQEPDSFDMAELDTAILEIEGFISDLDEKI
ncbi:MAG: serine/threonine-protein phosphatase [Gammaproteobacteria bacterium]|nr:serine/threonine-protein phosphatase [Gammaproteobacteria bacterium]